MRWRFTDSIDTCDPWQFICGAKGVSLEEYSLLERLGRPGALPETLLLESCVHFARWLVARSSEWRESCLLKEIKEFYFEAEAGMGDNLRVEVVVMKRDERELEVACEVSVRGRRIARGKMVLALVPLEEIQDAGALRILWGELAEKMESSAVK